MGSVPHIGHPTKATIYGHVMYQMPDPRGEKGAEILPTSCLPILEYSRRAEAAGRSTFF